MMNDTFLFLLLSRKHVRDEKTSKCKQGVVYQQSWCLDLGLPAIRTMRNIFL